MIDWRFIHIPKNGGNSFIKAYTYGNMEKGIHEPGVLYPNQEKFAIIRDPITRTVSVFTYQYRGTGDRSPKAFKEWLFSDMETMWVNGRYVSRMPLRMADPQVRWLTRDTWIFRFECMDEDTKDWVNRFDVDKCYIPYPHLNKTDRKWSISEYYDDECREKMMEIYKDDFIVWEAAIEHGPGYVGDLIGNETVEIYSYP